MERLPFRETFQSPFGDCGPVPCPALIGRPFALVRLVTNETDPGDVDPEVTLFRIKFSDGLEIDAFEEEVLEGYTWPGFNKEQRS